MKKHIKHVALAIMALVVFYTPEAFASGRKLIVNNTRHTFDLVLIVRAGEDPRNTAGTVDVTLYPMQQRWVDYGTHPNDIYLNGIKAHTSHNGEVIGTQMIVLNRNSQVDNTLNQYNAVTISEQDLTIHITGFHKH